MSRITVAKQMSGIEYEKGRRIANNTYHYFTPEYPGHASQERIRLHLTDIAVREGNILTLYTGGWMTITTKDRINLALDKFHAGLTVFSDRGAWYIGAGWILKERKPFVDGIQIDLRSNVIMLPEGAEKEIAQHKALKKHITAYCKGLRVWLKDHPEPFPESSDCWGCYFKACDAFSSGKEGNTEEFNRKSREKASDFFMGSGHLESHLKEKYYHGSIIYNALAWAGYPDPGLIIEMDIQDSMVRAVRRYLKAQFSLP